MEPSITYLKLAKVDYAEEIRDPEDCRTITEVKNDENRFEKALADQDESLKVEVKDAEALVLQKFRRKVLASENQRVTYLENEQDRGEPANYDKALETILYKMLEWYLKYAESDDLDGQYNLEFWP
ncbi:hypothetical protein F8M41_018660 [Gigaspora margarita]|uniref:Uncharacterized protein n=1 Tax=Gigaspora margarita TaxID=4874 RepID=A0A8H3ZV20_GIGMA|nr:hypothetical protein F8M41_018660 [Gigaspora margarita]